MKFERKLYCPIDKRLDRDKQIERIKELVHARMTGQTNIIGLHSSMDRALKSYSKNVQENIEVLVFNVTFELEEANEDN